MKKFSSQVAAFREKSLRRSLAVFQTSTMRVAADASQTVYEGGRMRHRTGFLRNSIVAGVNAQPSGPSDPAVDQQGGGEVATTVARARLGDIVWVGWAAQYARAREAGDGFLEGALTQWRTFVAESAAEARQRIR